MGRNMSFVKLHQNTTQQVVRQFNLISSVQGGVYHSSSRGHRAWVQPRPPFGTVVATPLAIDNHAQKCAFTNAAVQDVDMVQGVTRRFCSVAYTRSGSFNNSSSVRGWCGVGSSCSTEDLSLVLTLKYHDTCNTWSCGHVAMVPKCRVP